MKPKEEILHSFFPVPRKSDDTPDDHSFASEDSEITFEQSVSPGVTLSSAHTLQSRASLYGSSFGSIGANEREQTARFVYSREWKSRDNSLLGDELRRSNLMLAISQVMARNESHNIGSHVLSGLVTKENIAQLSDEINNPHYPASQYCPMPGLAQNQQAYHVNEYIAYLYSYLKTRMDFLADIVATPPALESSRLLIQEVIAGFDKNRIFLNRISGINGFRFRFVIRDCRHAPGLPQPDGNPEFCNATDIPVAVVNDILGQHAFYIILENIIRNTAKHARIGKGKEIIFTIEISECREDHSLYECTIYDNCPLSDARVDALVHAQNSLLNASILDNYGALREGNWGMIEMDVCAAYLRKISLEHIDDSAYDIPVSEEQEQAFAKDPAREKPLILTALRKGNYLAYRIYLPKPKELLVIDEESEAWKARFYQDGNLNEEALSGLERAGVLCLHCSDEPAIAKWKWKDTNSYSQQLLLILTATNLVGSNYIPQRVITLTELMMSYADYHSVDIANGDSAFIWNLLEEDRGQKFIVEAWRCLVRKKMSEKEITSINPQLNYSHFVAPQHNGCPLNVALDNHARDIKMLLKTNDYYEEYNHLTVDLIKNRIHPYVNGVLKKGFHFKDLFSFMESVLTPVLLIDERVQKHFYSTMHARIKKPVAFIAAKSGIHCPAPRLLDLSRQSFNKDTRDRLARYMNILLKEQNWLKGLDIVVIHLGIIEKILKSEDLPKTKASIREFIDAFKVQAAHIFGYAPFTIITSGRGKPEYLPEDVPFIGYSIVSQFAIENRSKSLLTQALYSARPKT